MFKVNRFLAIIILFFFVLSCGGGGGGEGGSTTTSSSDTTLNSSNAPKAGSTVVSSVLDLSTSAGTMLTVKDTADSNPEPPLSGILQAILYAYNETYGKAYKDTLYLATTSVSCPNGGSISISGSYPNLTMTFNQCKYGTATLNGSQSTSFSSITSTSASFTATTSNFTYSDSSISVTMTNVTSNYSISFSGTYLSYTGTMSGTIGYTLASVSKSYQYDNFKITMTSSSSGTTLSISGRIKDDCLNGWVTVSTNTAIFIPTGSAYPTSGAVLVTSGSDTVKVVFNSNSSISVYYNNTLVSTYTDYTQVRNLCNSLSLGIQWPVASPTVTQYYSYYNTTYGKYHAGMDITGNTAVYATASGTVRRIDNGTYVNENHNKGLKGVGSSNFI